MRVYADWTVYLTRRIGARLARGGSIRLPDEGGRRVLGDRLSGRDLEGVVRRIREEAQRGADG